MGPSRQVHCNFQYEFHILNDNSHIHFRWLWYHHSCWPAKQSVISAMLNHSFDLNILTISASHWCVHQNYSAWGSTVLHPKPNTQDDGTLIYPYIPSGWYLNHTCKSLNKTNTKIAYITSWTINHDWCFPTAINLTNSSSKTIVLPFDNPFVQSFHATDIPLQSDIPTQYDFLHLNVDSDLDC